MMYVICILAVYAFGLGASRTLRKRSFDLVRIMGDVIAFKRGKFVKRLIRKRMLKQWSRPNRLGLDHSKAMLTGMDLQRMPS